MRAYVVKAGDEVASTKCAHCPRRLRVGQTVLHHRFLDNAWHNEDFVVHVECVARVIAKAPAGKPSRRVETELKRIRTTGRVLELAG